MFAYQRDAKIVFDDASLDKAIEGLMAAKFRASGQTCVCANRVYLQEGIHDEFIERFSKVVRDRMIPGDPLAEGTSLGPLISQKATDKVERLVQNACEHGAEVVLGGVRSRQDAATFFPATILKNMKPTMQASREEWFGPVVAFYKFGTEQELLQMANDSEVGLAAYVYTNQMSQAWRAAELLQTGMVGVNTGMVSDPVAPFGGVKHSGFGREGGRVGVEEFQITPVCKPHGYNLGRPLTFGRLRPLHWEDSVFLMGRQCTRIIIWLGEINTLSLFERPMAYFYLVFRSDVG